MIKYRIIHDNVEIEFKTIEETNEYIASTGQQLSYEEVEYEYVPKVVGQEIDVANMPVILEGESQESWLMRVWLYLQSFFVSQP